MKKYLLLLLLNALLLWTFQSNGQQASSPKKNTKTPSIAEIEDTFTEGMRLYLKMDYSDAIMVWESLLQKEKNDPAIYFYLAKSYLEVKNSTSAIQNAKEANRLSPHSLDYGLFYADLLMINQKYPEAITCLVQLLQFDGMQSEVNIRLAQAYLYQENYDAALQALSKINLQLSEYPEIYRMKQVIYLKQNAFDQMIQEGEHLLLDYPEETLFSWEFLDIIDFSKWPNAENRMLKLSEKYPEMGQIQILLAKYYIEKKSTELAFRFIANSLKDPMMEDFIVGNVTMNAFALIQGKEDFKKAEILLDQILTVYPKNAKFLTLKGDLLSSDNRLLESQSYYRRSLKINSGKFEIWQRVIQIDFELNQIDSVIVHVDEALELFPNQGFLYFQLGFAQFMQSKNFQALASLESAKNYATTKDGWYIQLYSILGDTYQSLGRHKDSDTAFDIVLSVSPEEEHVLNNYSYYLSLRKINLDKAAQMSKILVDKFPENGTYLDTYAWVMFQKADYSIAVNFLEKAVNGDKKESAVVWEHYGDALFKANRLEEALDAWKKAKKLPGASLILDKKIQMKQFSEN